ncbi:MAG: hypothetical protein IKE45_10455 [Halomonas sp.]|nr:hypothetical protein [Halomonas sp.]MBR2514420.1 hypothetical protein [Halomonas sp.]
MNPDFADAAERHWEDGELLLTAQRLANADHLLGLSAECSLKAVMLGLGMTLRPSGAPEERRHQVHINRLWDEFQTFASDRGGAHYAAILSRVPAPFDGWNISDRYASRADIEPASVSRHQLGARRARTCLQEAMLDGVL